MTPSDKTVIAHCRSWVKNVIVKFNFCPFAAREVKQNTIRYCVIREPDVTKALEVLVNECLLLDKTPDIETTLLIFPQNYSDFECYLDFFELAEQLLVAQGYEGIYQLATFHPDYRFAGASDQDPANYTNRSPYPMLHLIREESIERVLRTYPDPEAIPERNIELCRKREEPEMRARLAACYNDEE